MTAELREQLQISLGAAYTIEHELGGGGMSRVFVAHDAQLGRKVVVKVLSPELAAGVNSERFKREIRVVASLQQANIVPLLSAGETNGLPFYTMPFVEGRSLRDRLSRDGSLPVPDAVSVLRDVARALTYAHERGVVHRDIKPENVLLSGEAAVVTDFGIAKALAAARGDSHETAKDAPGSTLTVAGMGVGTPAYMAPEQASGDPGTDHRADIYSFGCVAFELLSGRTPFHGRPVHQVLASHFGERPPAVTELRPDTPNSLAALVARCLEKDPAQRPQSGRELLQALDVTASVTTAEVLWRRSRTPLLISAPIAAVTLAAILLLVFRNSVDRVSTTPSVSLALVPFANVGGDSAQDFRADGLTDALQIEVKKLPGMSVAARSAASRFRGLRDLDAREVGRVLHVAYVLHGTYRSDGTTQRVRARLTRTSDGEDVWQDEFDHPVSAVFAAEDEIRDSVVTALQHHVGITRTTLTASSRGTTDTTAYNLYQLGQFLLGRRGTGVALAAQNFEKAIARDPGFARAHAGLSAALEILPNFSDTTFVDVHDRATAAARRALELDSTLSEAQTSLALAYMHAFQWAAADSQFRVALTRDPGDPAAHLQYGRFFTYTGRAREALDEFQRAKALDPTSALISSWFASSLLVHGRQAEAFAEIDRALQIDSMNPPIIFFGALVSAARGRRDVARKLLARTPPIPVWKSAAAQGHASLGDRDSALRVLREVETSRARSFRHSSLAVIALALGDTARALDELEHAMDAREFWPSAPILSSPTVDQVRKSPRFAALLRRANLDVSIFTSPTGARPPSAAPAAK